MSLSLVWGMLAVSGVAWGQQAPVRPTFDRLTLEAVEIGDFDCSGGLDQATMYSDADGRAIVEIAFEVPEREQQHPQLPSRSDLGLTVGDVDGDRCEELLVTAFGQTEMFASGERAWIAAGALDGAGDAHGDQTLVFSRMNDGGITGVGQCTIIRTCWNVCDCYTRIPVQIGPFSFETEVCTQWHMECGTDVVY